MMMPTIFFRTSSLLLIITIFLFFSHADFTLAKTLDTTEHKFISYTDVGQGAPLLLIHAFPTDRRLWEVQQEGLKKYFRVITLDLWGFGQSSQVDGQAVTMGEYAEEVKQLLDQLHIKKAIIAGESMGGYIALAFLDKYPDKIDGLILSDTQSIADSPETKTKREAQALDVLEHGTSHLIDGFMPKALSSNASEQLKITLRHILEAQLATAMASALRGMALRSDTSALLADSSLPMLIITGDQDTLISPQQSKNMHALAKNSKLIVIANAGHLSSLEQPEQWNQAVMDLFYKNSSKITKT
jgi:pimeloyl-ACP methyl ester carboxylesterase